jgi:hypothetical protein
MALSEAENATVLKALASQARTLLAVVVAEAERDPLKAAFYLGGAQVRVQSAIELIARWRAGR